MINDLITTIQSGLNDAVVNLIDGINRTPIISDISIITLAFMFKNDMLKYSITTGNDPDGIQKNVEDFGFTTHCFVSVFQKDASGNYIRQASTVSVLDGTKNLPQGAYDIGLPLTNETVITAIKDSGYFKDKVKLYGRNYLSVYQSLAKSDDCILFTGIPI